MQEDVSVEVCGSTLSLKLEAMTVIYTMQCLSIILHEPAQSASNKSRLYFGESQEVIARRVDLF